MPVRSQAFETFLPTAAVRSCGPASCCTGIAINGCVASEHVTCDHPSPNSSPPISRNLRHEWTMTRGIGKAVMQDLASRFPEISRRRGISYRYTTATPAISLTILASSCRLPGSPPWHQKRCRNTTLLPRPRNLFATPLAEIGVALGPVRVISSVDSGDGLGESCSWFIRLAEDA